MGESWSFPKETEVSWGCQTCSSHRHGMSAVPRAGGGAGMSATLTLSWADERAEFGL